MAFHSLRGTLSDTLARLQSALSDRYGIQRELGRGDMATVYLATDLKHEREVAIKVLHPDLPAPPCQYPSPHLSRATTLPGTPSAPGRHPSSADSAPPSLRTGPRGSQQCRQVARIRTPQGEILFLRHDQTPRHKESFLRLAAGHYWDNLTFKRVSKNFVIEGAAPIRPRASRILPTL